MPSRHQTLRTAALLLTAAFAVHQLRYALAFGHHAGHALAHQGHGYLLFAGPLLGSLLGLAVARMLRALAAPPAGRTARVHRLGVLWPLCSLALVALYTGQETLEGLVASGHPHGWAAVAASGGWLALPLAAAAGLVVALLLHVAARAEEAPPLRVVAIARALRSAPPAFVLPALPAGVLRPALARHAPGRGPPSACR
ncbi:MAG TPA: hypothetical protein VFT42_06850 [Solirubrobacteraceae bacterium]|nr:hypothetical protein [Solirubrobacteraceae bacterium]